MTSHRAFIPLSELICWKRVRIARRWMTETLGKSRGAEETIDAAITRLLILHSTFCLTHPLAEAILPASDCPYLGDIARELGHSLDLPADATERALRDALDPARLEDAPHEHSPRGHASEAGSPREPASPQEQREPALPQEQRDPAPVRAVDGVIVVSGRSTILVFCAETGLETIEISSRTFDQLRCRWEENQNKEPSNASLWSAVATLMMRYDALDCWSDTKSAGYQFQIVGTMLAHLCNLELFAAPFNATMTRYCSLFPDVDAPFGSIGKYPEVLDSAAAAGSRAFIAANPPFIEQVLNDLAPRARALCGLGVSWIILTPDWSDNEGVQALESSAFKTLCPDIEAQFIKPDRERTAMDRFRSFCLKPFSPTSPEPRRRREDSGGARKRKQGDPEAPALSPRRGASKRAGARAGTSSHKNRTRHSKRKRGRRLSN